MLQQTARISIVLMQVIANINPGGIQMSKSKTYVDDSAIHGKGLFAKKAIKAGEVIGTVEGKKTRKDGPHVLWLTEKTGFHVQCDLRYINHNNKPNACYYNSLEVIALRNIKPGEEITHDYQWD